MQQNLGFLKNKKSADTITDQQHYKKSNQKQPERITQLQCFDTISQLQLFFIQSLNESFKYLPNVLAHVYNQIELIVGLAEYRLTIANSQPHPGDLLQNIEYKPMSRSTKIFYLLLTVIIPYAKRKLFSYLIKNNNSQREGWREKLLKILNIIDKIIMALNLINLSIFIRDGKYRSLVQRILKIPMQFIHGESARILDFTLMNRKIIWNIYQIFLKTVIPYANDLFGSTLKNIFYLNSYLDVDASDKSRNCMFCQDAAKMPMKTNCDHLSCYYCYSINADNSEKQSIKQAQSCRNCGTVITQWKKMF